MIKFADRGLLLSAADRLRIRAKIAAERDEREREPRARALKVRIAAPKPAARTAAPQIFGPAFRARLKDAERDRVAALDRQPDNDPHHRAAAAAASWDRVIANLRTEKGL